MTEQQLLPSVDPGYGDPKAAPGTVGWAQLLRLQMQGLVKEVEEKPGALAGYIDKCVNRRTWTLLNYPEEGPGKPKSKEKFFGSFEEYCGYPEPWGLGVPWEKIRPYVESRLSPQAHALLIAKPDQRRNNGAHAASQPRDSKGRLLAVEKPVSHTPNSSGRDENSAEPPNSSGRDENSAKRRTQKKETLLRAILRAPQPVQQLYRESLIAQDVAAKLGPFRPTPEQAATIAEITEAIRATPAPKTEQEKRAVQRQINATVREKLGATPDPIETARKAVLKLESKAVVDLIVSVVEHLDAQTFDRLWGRLARLDRKPR